MFFLGKCPNLTVEWITFNVYHSFEGFTRSGLGIVITSIEYPQPKKHGIILQVARLRKTSVLVHALVIFI